MDCRTSSCSIVAVTGAHAHLNQSTAGEKDEKRPTTRYPPACSWTPPRFHPTPLSLSPPPCPLREMSRRHGKAQLVRRPSPGKQQESTLFPIAIFLVPKARSRLGRFKDSRLHLWCAFSILPYKPYAVLPSVSRKLLWYPATALGHDARTLSDKTRGQGATPKTLFFFGRMQHRSRVFQK